MKILLHFFPNLHARKLTRQTREKEEEKEKKGLVDAFQRLCENKKVRKGPFGGKELHFVLSFFVLSEKSNKV